MHSTLCLLLRKKNVELQNFYKRRKITNVEKNVELQLKYGFTRHLQVKLIIQLKVILLIESKIISII